MRRRLCTVADATVGLLRCGEVGPSFQDLKVLTSALPPQPVSLAMLQSSARDRSAKTRLLNAQFLRRELTTRRAHALSLLRSMPSPLAEQPAVAQLADVYWQRLRGLLELPPIVCEADERDFAARMAAQNALIQKQTPDEFMMCVDALGACRKGDERLPAQQQLEIDRQLDALFLARIGMRCLLEHYVASENPVEGFAGVIDRRCSPVALCEAVAAQTVERLRAEYGDAPRVEVLTGRAGIGSDQTFSFVPSHFTYVLRTLLENSCVATLRHHHRQQRPAAAASAAGVAAAGTDSSTAVPMMSDASGKASGGGNGTGAGSIPPVRVVVAVSEGLVQLKLVDEAGGIRRSSLANVWSYRALDSKWWKPQDGLSLPVR